MIRCMVVQLLLVLLAGVAIGGTNGTALVVYDDFDDGVLGDEWSTAFSTCFGWEHTETNSDLIVTDIAPYGFGSTCALRAHVFLVQQFAAITDFRAEFRFAWDSPISNRAQQSLWLTLRGNSGELIAYMGYNDAWVNLTGSTSAYAGGNGYASGSDTMPFTGSADVAVTRTNGQVIVYWDGQPVVIGTSTSELTHAEIDFQFGAYDGSLGTSFFGTESVDFVRIEGVLAEPAVPTCGELLGDANQTITDLQADLVDADALIAQLESDVANLNAMVDKLNADKQKLWALVWLIVRSL